MLIRAEFRASDEEDELSQGGLEMALWSSCCCKQQKNIDINKTQTPGGYRSRTLVRRMSYKNAKLYVMDS